MHTGVSADVTPPTYPHMEARHGRGPSPATPPDDYHRLVSPALWAGHASLGTGDDPEAPVIEVTGASGSQINGYDWADTVTVFLDDPPTGHEVDYTSAPIDLDVSGDFWIQFTDIPGYDRPGEDIWDWTMSATDGTTKDVVVLYGDSARVGRRAYGMRGVGSTRPAALA